jgi:putative membrane protein
MRSFRSTFVSSLLLCAAALLSPAAYALGEAEGATIKEGSKIAVSDVRWMEKAARAYAAQVQAGRLALAQGNRNEVRQFGKQAAERNAKMKEELAAIAALRGVLLPEKPDSAHVKALEKLAPLSGDAFDTAYMDSAGTKDHIAIARLMQEGVDSLKDQDLKDYARRSLGQVKTAFEDVRDLKPADTAASQAARK